MRWHGNFLGKTNENILTYRRKKIKPELSQNYRHISVEKGEHQKLLFGDDLPKIIKDMVETKNVGQSLTQKTLSSSSTMRPQNSFLYKSWGYPQTGHQFRQHTYQLQRSQRFGSLRFNKSVTIPPKPHHWKNLTKKLVSLLLNVHLWMNQARQMLFPNV